MIGNISGFIVGTVAAAVFYDMMRQRAIDEEGCGAFFAAVNFGPLEKAEAHSLPTNSPQVRQVSDF